MARVISQRGSWHRVAGAFTCTLASGMAVEASLVMKFCDSDAKAFPIERGRSLTLRDGLIPFRDPSSHSGVMSVPTGVFHSRTLRFCVPVSEERAVVKMAT